MSRQVFSLVVSFVSDFLIGFTTAVMAAGIETGAAGLPSKAVWIMGILAGLLAASRRMQAAIEPALFSQPKPTKETT